MLVSFNSISFQEIAESAHMCGEKPLDYMLSPLSPKSHSLIIEFVFFFLHLLSSHSNNNLDAKYRPAVCNIFMPVLMSSPINFEHFHFSSFYNEQKPLSVHYVVKACDSGP